MSLRLINKKAKSQPRLRKRSHLPMILSQILIVKTRRKRKMERLSRGLLAILIQILNQRVIKLPVHKIIRMLEILLIRDHRIALMRRIKN